jgi:hypothetical protein
MDKINSEVSVYKPVNMKVPALVSKECEMSEELQQLAQNLNFNAKKTELILSYTGQANLEIQTLRHLP